LLKTTISRAETLEFAGFNLSRQANRIVTRGAFGNSSVKVGGDRLATEKLVCRYCCNDDLPPSFVKRRDARCRAFFKKHYGSSPSDKKIARTRKTKAAK
jgi:hypothetical protein